TLDYRDEQGRASQRTIWPVTVGYHETVRLLVAWCELRSDFRNFRTDRVAAAEFLDDRYPERPAVLRARWRVQVEAERKRHGAKDAACGT
ncbi:MAG: WYL domain-containing protein, partial [Caulobacteraceae bacterium]